MLCTCNVIWNIGVIKPSPVSVAYLCECLQNDAVEILPFDQCCYHDSCGATKLSYAMLCKLSRTVRGIFANIPNDYSQSSIYVFKHVYT